MRHYVEYDMELDRDDGPIEVTVTGYYVPGDRGRPNTWDGEGYEGWDAFVEGVRALGPDGEILQLTEWEQDFCEAALLENCEMDEDPTYD